MANHRIDVKKIKFGFPINDSDIKMVKWTKGKECKHPGDFFSRNFLGEITDKSEQNIVSILGVKLEFYRAFLIGKVRIEEELAKKLETLTGFSKATWIDLQNKFDDVDYQKKFD